MGGPHVCLICGNDTNHPSAVCDGCFNRSDASCGEIEIDPEEDDPGDDAWVILEQQGPDKRMRRHHFNEDTG